MKPLAVRSNKAWRELAEKALAELHELKKKYLYHECGEYADDAPGLRGECTRKKREGKPCDRCPEAYRAAHPEIVV